MVYAPASIEEGEAFIKTEAEEEASFPRAGLTTRFPIRRGILGASVLIGLVVLLAVAWSSPVATAMGKPHEPQEKFVPVDQEDTGAKPREELAAITDADIDHGSSTSLLHASVDNTTGLWGSMGRPMPMPMGSMP